MKFPNPFKKKKQEPLPEEEVKEVEQSSRYEDFVNVERNGQPLYQDGQGQDIPDAGDYDDMGAGNPFAGGEQSINTEPLKEQSRTGRRLRGGLVAGLIAALAIGAVGVMAHNFLKPKAGIGQQQQRQAQNSGGPTASVSATPGSTLPGSYSDLATYEQQQKQAERERMIRSGQLNPAKEQKQTAEARIKARRQAEQQARQPDVTPPSRPSMPARQQGNGQRGGEGNAAPRPNYSQYNNPVGFSVTESGKVSQDSGSTIFSALPGTGQATGKKYKLHTGTVIPVTLLTGMTSDSKSAGVTAQVRQDVYDSLTGTHLLIPQGSKIVGRAGGATGRRMAANFDRIILPNGASIKLSGPQATDGAGYSGLKDKYDEKWGPTIKGAFLAGIFTGIADWVGDIDTKTDDGTLVQSAWGNVAEKISDRLGDKADRLDTNESPAVKIRPGFQFQVYLTNDIEIYQYQPLQGEPR